jgi:photosystem II stability/assembly factor-like uncharacterized protein
MTKYFTIFFLLLVITEAQSQNLTWVQTNQQSGNNLLSLVCKGGFVFAGNDLSTPGNITMSSDEGNSWIKRDSGINGSIIRCLALDSLGNLYAGNGSSSGTNAVYRSSNNGVTWDSIFVPLHYSGKPTYVLDIQANSKNWIYVLANYYDSNVVYRSSDHGKSWVKIKYHDRYSYFKHISIGKDNTLYLVAASSDVLSYSTDDGDTWNTWTNGLINLGLECVGADIAGNVFVGMSSNGVSFASAKGSPFVAANKGIESDKVTCIHFRSSGQILIGTNGYGVFASNNNGTDWTAINNGLTNLQVTAIDEDPIGTVYCASSGGGVYRLALQNSVCDQKSAEILSCYPNPTTNILYLRINNAQLVENCMIVNSLGVNIMTIQTRGLSSSNELNINVSNLQAGLYTCRIYSNNSISSLPFLIIH